jgi:hypothetical protein
MGMPIILALVGAGFSFLNQHYDTTTSSTAPAIAGLENHTEAMESDEDSRLGWSWWRTPLE